MTKKTREMMDATHKRFDKTGLKAVDDALSTGSVGTDPNYRLCPCRCCSHPDQCFERVEEGEKGLEKRWARFRWTLTFSLL